MEAKEQVNLTFTGVDIIDVKFNLTAYYEDKAPVKLNITPKVYRQKDTPDHFKLLLTCNISSENYFELMVVAIGQFKMENSLSDEIKRQLVNVNAVAIMFPYLRSFVSLLTSNLGSSVQPITIPTQFFKGEIEELTEEPLSK